MHGFACRHAVVGEPFPCRRSFEVDKGFEMMARNNGDRREELASDIRGQFGTEATMRFLRTLPAFRVEADIPDRFKELLDRLDGIEGSVAWGQRGQ